MQTEKTEKITGIGSALVDILINESDQFLAEAGKDKGGMTLVENQDIEALLEKTSQSPSVVPGGAACNTIMGVGCLGGDARFIGMRGYDEYGQIFEQQLIKCRVSPMVSACKEPTGKVLSVITPDAQRSMFTFLGASTQLMPETVTADLFEGTAIAMIEGYLLFNQNLMMAALKAAKSAGAMIALDLASFEVVNATKDILNNIIPEYVDILIANEDEARAFVGDMDENETIKKLSEYAAYAILKVGKDGSYIAHDGSVVKVAAQTGSRPVVDTTGAGDLWAAGFLFGLSKGLSLETCGQIASACGYEVCQVIGAQIPEEGWERIRHLI